MRKFARPLATTLVAAAALWPVQAREAGGERPGERLDEGHLRPGHVCQLIAVWGQTPSFVPRPEMAPIAADAPTINVTYVGFGAFPQAQAAFQYAVNIWRSLITTTVPINVTATFEPLPTGVLGSAGANGHYRDFPGAPQGSTGYPIPLMEALMGANQNDNDADIEASFNSTFSVGGGWYFGLDGDPATNQWDFVSVVLHELGHGLGFVGFARMNSAQQGAIRQQGFPSIYDRFATTETGASLLAFVDPSAALATQLTQGYSAANPRGPGVYFSGTRTNSANGNLSARLYTPPTWSSGSSYSHLDESTYPQGNVNSLMTYAIANNEGIHNPGPVTLGMFSDMGWTTASCAAGVINATSASAARTGGAATVAVTIGSTCAWTATSSAAFITITGGATGTGNGTVSYTVAANPTTTTRTGTLTIAGNTFTVTQAGNTVTVSPSAMAFSGVVGLVPITPAQTATITFDGTGSSTWTASTSQPWVQLSATSGTGSGTFTVGIVNTGNVLNGVTAATATITVTSSNVTNAPRTIAVSLTLAPGTQSFTAPSGQVDTPAQNMTGAQGAVAITGWAIDDVGLQHVRIYRQCLPFDTPAACQTLLGASVVLLGQASIIPGARPDVEALYPSVPAANAAGWGFLILSNLLPNIPVSNPNGGGVGTFVLYAVATDVEGRQTLLGRTAADHTPTTVTVANNTIAKPFGAIDTPGQGATTSGTLNNFGWVLTPDPGTSVLVPVNGSTITVYVDGAPIGTATYNLCRGSVGATPPAGVLCDDDVSAIFRGNGTAYRNLDAARGAIALRTINTATLSNGLHTISWGVADSAGRVEGIGSRYFSVLNSGADEAIAGSEDPASDVRSDIFPDVFARTGFDPSTARTPLATDAAGVAQVRVGQLSRVEMVIPGVDEGVLIAHDGTRPLPVGVAIDRARGLVTWAPGPAHLGTYRLVFDTGGADTVEVDVTVTPDTVAPAPMLMFMDSPSAGSVVDGGDVRVEGWALDPDAMTGSGIGAVHIWASSPTVTPVFVGSADLDVARPDVAAAHGDAAARAGFRWVGTLPKGEWTLTAYVWVVRTQRFEDARSVRVVVR